MIGTSEAIEQAIEIRMRLERPCRELVVRRRSLRSGAGSRFFGFRKKLFPPPCRFSGCVSPLI